MHILASLESVAAPYGLGVLERAREADPRLSDLIGEFGLLIELVTDVGERGSPLLMATVSEDGELNWIDSMRPRE